MNNRGFGIVEFAAWLIVASFILELSVLVMRGIRISEKLNLTAYNQIVSALK